MKITQLACTVLLCGMTSSVSGVDVIDDSPNAQPSPGPTAGQSKPEVVQDAKTAAESQAQKQIRARSQVKQWSPPPGITVSYPKSK
jgi:hypothetical protein